MNGHFSKMVWVWRERAERALGTLLYPAAPSGPDGDLVAFRCNLCGEAATSRPEQLHSEGAHCPRCRSFSRIRACVYALAAELGLDAPVLAQAAARPSIRGIGCSDVYAVAVQLRRLFEYQNTFYERRPRLDLVSVDWRRYPERSFDFITCSDVLEHVPRPLGRVTHNLWRLLRPGGILVVTAPIVSAGDHTPQVYEHFPELTDWEIANEQAGRRVLLERRADGSVVRHEDLIFHGGKGLTLEFRVFTLEGLHRALEDAGFRVRKVYGESIPEYGIALNHLNVVTIAERP